jgi:hypothetical protein
MSQEILDLLYFYRSPIGRVTHKIILNIIHEFWHENPLNIIGIGYCDPFLDVLNVNKSECLALMPSFTGLYARTGIETYPSALFQETNLPLKANNHKHILCIHILEHTAHPNIFLTEIYNSLEAEGEVIFIVPNRYGTWARNENTPFGSGRPYSKKQLYRLLQEAGFIITDYRPALFTAPNALLISKYYSHFLEKIGTIILSRYSGLHIIRALKRIYVPPIITNKNDILDIMPNFKKLLPTRKSSL